MAPWDKSAETTWSWSQLEVAGSRDRPLMLLAANLSTQKLRYSWLFRFRPIDVAVSVFEEAFGHFDACHRCCVFGHFRRGALRGQRAEHQRTEQREADGGSTSDHF
jgi:hypothetical protein